MVDLVPGVPVEYSEEIECDELKIADLEISMTKEDVKPDLTKPKVDSNGKAISLHYVNNAIKVLRYVFKETLIDEENDIKKYFYNGGFKICECTLDLLEYLNETLLPFELKGKNVIDICCGHRLLGTQALLHTAENVYFQNFNVEVLKFALIPNIYMNRLLELLPKARFIAGDWSKTYEKIKSGIDDVAGEGTLLSAKAAKFDLVLMSEVLYCKDNYQKIARLITELLSETDVCLISTNCTILAAQEVWRSLESIFN